MLIGYARVSTADQDWALQIDALTKAGCEKLFTDEASGAKLAFGTKPKCSPCLVASGAQWDGLASPTLRTASAGIGTVPDSAKVEKRRSCFGV